VLAPRFARVRAGLEDELAAVTLADSVDDIERRKPHPLRDETAMTETVVVAAADT
jgi:hypothetical protein